MYLDAKARKDFKENPKSVVGWLLMSSWLYYCRPQADPILSDPVFDNMCRWLYDNYDSIDHKLKYLINKENLKAGTLYAIKDTAYPKHIVRLAELLSEGGEVIEY